MEMPSSIRGDKHEFCRVVIMLKHIRSFDKALTSPMQDCIE